MGGGRCERSSEFRSPEVVDIRHARIEDADGIARVRAESWRAAYRGIVPDDYLDGIDVAEWAERQRRNMENQPADLVSLVANDGDLIVGWTALGPNRMADLPYAGELYTIYLLPSHWRRGIGRLLMAAAAQSSMHMGMKSMILWVFAENWPARRFNEALGGTLVSEHRYTIGGVSLPEVAYGWSDLGALTTQAGAVE